MLLPLVLSFIIATTVGYAENLETIVPKPRVEPYVASHDFEISAESQQVLVDFLSQYVSLFSFGVDEGNGYYLCIRENIMFDSRPHVVFTSRWVNHYVSPYTDFYGNPIDYPVFLQGVGFAADFRLLDVGFDKPIIVMQWGAPSSCASLWEVWRYVDGEYRNIGELRGYGDFFRVPDGRLLIVYNDGLSVGAIGYYQVVLTEQEIIKRQFHLNPNVTPRPGGFDSFTWIVFHSSEEFQTNPTLLTHRDIPLTPVPRLTWLEDEIRATVRAELGV